MTDLRPSSPTGSHDREAPARDSVLPLAATGLKATYYFFASTSEGPRTRRLADVGALLGALGLLAISVVDHNAAGETGQRLTETLASLPGIIADIGQAVLILSSAFALVILVAACVRRRFRLVRDIVLAISVSFVVAMVVGYVVTGEWPQLGTVGDVAGARDFPVVRIAVLVGALLVASPHLSRPFRRASRAAVVLSGVSAVVVGAGLVSDVLGAVAVGWAAAASLHLIFGSPAGAPTLERVRSALLQLGLTVDELTALGERHKGVASYHAVDDHGRSLMVEVAGRDARNAQLAARVWRSLWQRESDGGLTSTRLQMAEHAALMVLLADRAGVRVPELVAVGEARPNDALIVFLDAGASVAADGAGRISDEVTHNLWEQLLLAHAARLAHRRLDVSSVLVGARDEVVLTGWRSAVSEAEPAVLAIDIAAMLTVTALLLGSDDAIRIAREACGDDRVVEALPYLQTATLSTELRQRVKESDLDLAELRLSTAAELAVDPPDVVQIQRVSIGKILMALLIAVAVTSLLSWIADIGLDTLLQAIADADPAWLLLALVVGQTPFLAGALSVQGSVPDRVPYGPTVIEQMAVAFVKLAVPSSAARVLTNVRYLQLQGVDRVTAFGGGGLDAVSGFIVQVGVLAFLTLVDVIDLHAGSLLSVVFDPDEIDWSNIVLALVLIVGFGCGLLMIRKVRVRFRDLAREAGEGTRRLADVLRSWRQVTRLFGGNFLSDFLLAVTLWVVCSAYGVHVSFATLLAIHVLVSLINGFVPVPGGIGVVETLLSTALIAAGVGEVDALAIAITWRAVTFYLPPIWGGYSMRWLTRHGYL